MDEEVLRYAKKLESELKWEEAACCYIQLLNKTLTEDLYERVGWCLSRAEKYNDSIKYLNELHQLKPQSAKYIYMIGYHYYCLKDWYNAVIWFEKALSKFPNYFVVKYRLSYAYVQIAGKQKQLTKAEYWKALHHLKDAHKIWDSFNDEKKQKEKNTYFDINFLHGKILMDLPNYCNEAIDHFKRALEIKTDEVCQYNLSKAYYLSGDYYQAKSLLPKSNKYYIIELSAYIAGKIGNYDDAITIVTHLLKTRGKDYLYCFLAEVYLLNGNLCKAYEMGQKAISTGKNNHKNFYILAKVYNNYGLYLKSIEFLDKAIDIKKRKFNSSYEEATQMREHILKNIPIGYTDNEDILKKLQNQNNSNAGIIVKYNSQKGFGFINDSSTDIFFHISNCQYDSISIGDKVLFSREYTGKGQKAVNIVKTH